MSRSYKHTTISAITTAQSEKKDKQLANRRFSDPWDFQKDGKRYFSPDEARLFPKLFRK